MKIKNHECNLCNRKFHGSWYLSTHKRKVHQGERLFGCERCEYKASTMFNLNLHRTKMHNIEERLNKAMLVKLIESGQHPYCDKDTLDKIKQHMRTIDIK